MNTRNSRLQQIIQQLLTSDDLQTSSELVTALQVSSKTIQTDIKELNKLLNDDIAYIESYRGKGYRINVINEDGFKQFLQKLVEKNNQVVPTEPEDRVQFLMEKLLLQTSYIKMDALAEELFISRSTLQSDLKTVREILERYNLFLDQKPNYGIKVCGDEMKIRFCISEYIFNQKPTMVDQTTAWLEILPKEEIEWIRNSILSKLRKHQTIITDISLHNLITYIAIACKRIHDGKVVEIYHEELSKITDKKEYMIAKEIVEEIEQKLKVSFSVNETAYLAIHLQGAKKVHSESEIEEAKSILDEDIQQLTRNILKRIDKVYSLNLSEDKELVLTLSLHLKPAISRYKYQMNLRNPMLEEIKNKYPFSFEAALTGADVIMEILGISIDESEIGYMALHLEAALERQEKSERNKKRCLIVCASGLGTAQLLLLKLKYRFRDELNIVGTTGYYNLNNQSVHDLDFIISTIPIPEKLPVPVIQISTLLGNQDVNKIEKLIHNDIEIMKNYMREQSTYLKMDFSTKEEVIQFLGNKLLEAGMVNTDFISSVLEREKYSPTSFGNLVAIPHPIEPQADDTFWSIVTLRNPIQWGGKPVQIICLLNISKRNRMDDLKPMYDVLVKLLDNRLLLQKLLHCETYNEFKTVLTKA
ncbi:BglG family transcription antiterminator [Thermoactinomyces mirandus]|uniref:Transcription antiterminator n=1 Tax=Thermoactinomyces mirandus TaxID=2756294 RepID=A0A7W1XUJ1_9BACL|nr:BglG family transcription antiterminator [Thermoactinomyces mirandus]MBA4603554.1 transcription antiterminator [Thermoactinomyces mirandus]